MGARCEKGQKSIANTSELCVVLGSCLGKSREAHARITTSLGEHKDSSLCLKAQGNATRTGTALVQEVANICLQQSCF